MYVYVSLVKTEENSESAPVILSSPNHTPKPIPQSTSVSNRTFSRGHGTPSTLSSLALVRKGIPVGCKLQVGDGGESGSYFQDAEQPCQPMGAGAGGSWREQALGGWRMAGLLFLYNKRGSL